MTKNGKQKKLKGRPKGTTGIGHFAQTGRRVGAGKTAVALQLDRSQASTIQAGFEAFSREVDCSRGYRTTLPNFVRAALLAYSETVVSTPGVATLSELK